jgi:hypothetical protein
MGQRGLMQALPTARLMNWMDPTAADDCGRDHTAWQSPILIPDGPLSIRKLKKKATIA